MKPPRPAPLATLALAAAAALTLIFGAAGAQAKEVVDYFGTEAGFGTAGGEFRFPRGVAVNTTGAGPAEAGDIYVADAQNHRIQRFGRDDNGTPDPYDDTYFFISAWGADVVSTGGTGDTGNEADANYEICTVASQCKAGVASDGNGTAAGNGALSNPAGIAIDQDTGNVYVVDPGAFTAPNTRVNVYDGAGTFLRSFGWDVAASGPGDLAGPNETQTLTVNADGGKFSLLFRGYLGASTGAARNGGGVIGFTSGSTFSLQAPPTSGAFEVGQGFSAFYEASGLLGSNLYPPGTTITACSPDCANPDTLTLSQPTSDARGAASYFGHDLPHDATAQQVEDALNSLPTVGGAGGSVSVSGPAGGPYQIDFGGSLADADVPPILARGENLTLGAGVGNAIVAETVKGGIYEVCEDADGDVCRGGSPGAATGQLDFFVGDIAVSAPDGNPSTGTVFLANPGLAGSSPVPEVKPINRVNTYALDGSSPSDFGSADNFASGGPESIAVDSRGIVYASDSQNSGEIERYDTQGLYSAGTPGFLAPIAAPPLAGGLTYDLALDPDSDGPGPADTDVLYVGRGAGGIRQFGPANDPGLAAPPAAVDALHATGPTLGFNPGLAVDETGERLYAATYGVFGFPDAHGVYVLDDAGPAPTASLDSITDVTATSALAHATIDPNGPPALSYHFEYSLNGTDWTSLPTTLLGIQQDPQSIDFLFSLPGGGLSPNTTYHLRVSAAKKFATPILTTALQFTTDPAPPDVETAGSPVRTTTTATLNGRVNPRNTAAQFRFEYGSQGPCSANPCAQTPLVAAGDDDEVHLVAERIEGLQPNTTYHYRVMADNGVGGAPVFGEDMTLTTRASDAPLTHGDFPGPPGSDRAWEQVSTPQTGGNPVGSVAALGSDASGAGNHAIYTINGGTPLSVNGSIFNQLLAERVQSAPHQGSWQNQLVVGEVPGIDDTRWFFFPAHDFSQIIGRNHGELFDLWRIAPGGPSTQIFPGAGGLADAPTDGIAVSADASRVLYVPDFQGSLDSAHPASSGYQLYDVSAPGEPQLVSLLPGGQVPACGIADGQGAFLGSAVESHWLSTDGSYAFFPSSGNSCGAPPQLYLRDLDADATKLISGPTLSGQSCKAVFIRSSSDAAFFWTQSRLDPADSAPASCGGNADGDVYRYDLASEALQCVTCVVVGGSADVLYSDGTALRQIGVAANGSRVYFISTHRLLAGAATRGIYRLDVASGDLAYLAPATDTSITVGDAGNSGHSALSADGTVLVFKTDAPEFDPLGATATNGGSDQYYRYDDQDRSLVCVSCPADGSAPRGSINVGIGGFFATDVLVNGDSDSTALSADGEVLAFYTPTPLAGADQNTTASGQSPDEGGDIYEWRDGRPHLVTDGVSDSGYPALAGVSPSGQDVFFTAFAAYTQDAPDANRRLYTARIGGGFEFPPASLPPCDLNSGACEGAASSAPDLPGAGSAVVAGQGDPRDPFPRDCSATSARARKLSRVARSLRHRAKKAASAKRAKSLRRRAGVQARKAKSARRGARSCRRANGRAAR